MLFIAQCAGEKCRLLLATLAMINDAFIFSCNNPPQIGVIVCFANNPKYVFVYLLADDDSDSSPHDFEGGNIDLEYGLSSHMNIGQHAFSQMQVK